MHFARIFSYLTVCIMAFGVRSIWAGECVGPDCGPGGCGTTFAAAQEQNEPMRLSGPGKKIPLANGGYATYAFSTKPAVGTVVLTFNLFDAQDQRISNLVMTGSYGMPAMPKAHASGTVPFTITKKGAYQLPVKIAMKGAWEVVITISDGTTVLLSGVIPLEI